MTRAIPPLDTDDELLHHFAEVPPIVILDAALATVAAIVWEEHRPEPLLLLDPDHDLETACLTSHLIIERIKELLHLLRLHLAEMKRVLPSGQDDYLFKPSSPIPLTKLGQISLKLREHAHPFCLAMPPVPSAVDLSDKTHSIHYSPGRAPQRLLPDLRRFLRTSC
jgi:hypothetical protein